MKPYHLFVLAFLFVLALSWRESDYVPEAYDIHSEIEWPVEVLQEMKRQ